MSFGIFIGFIAAFGEIKCFKNEIICVSAIMPQSYIKKTNYTTPDAEVLVEAMKKIAIEKNVRVLL